MKILLSIALLAAPPVALKAVEFSLPDDNELFAGPDADLLNSNCAACHGATMILYQPRMTEAQWAASVTKMRSVYKAPIDDADAARLPAALVRVTSIE